jgi:hypothetical protein
MIHRKHHLHHAIYLTSETVQKSHYNWIIEETMFYYIQEVESGHNQCYQQIVHIIYMLQNIMVKYNSII